MLKKDLREKLRRALAEIDPSTLHERSVRACRLLCEHVEFRRAEIVMVFLSGPGEVDTNSLVLEAWAQRKRVLAPQINLEARRLLPVEIRSLTEDLAISHMGIREPVSGIPFPISMIDLVIVPGLGFDDYGNRLGRGRGFYDRFLAHPEFTGTACAMAFEQQMTSSVPVGPLDRVVDMLVTDDEVRRFKR